MVRQITSYSFNAETKQITFSDYPSGINLERVRFIANATIKEMIYLLGDTDLGGTVSSNILTLVNTITGMSNTDKLLIYYDDPLYDVGGKTGESASTTYTDTTTLMAFVKGLIKIQADVWDDTRHSVGNHHVDKEPGWDVDNDLVKVESQYTYGTELAADGILVSGAGFCHLLFINCTTAGTLVLRDSITAGGGTVIRTMTVPTGIYSLPIDTTFTTGLYADYGTMVGNVNASKR